MSRVLPGFGQDDPSAGLRAGLPVCRASARVTVCVGCAAGSRCVLAAVSFGWMRRLIQGTVRERTRQKKETSVSVGLSRKG